MRHLLTLSNSLFSPQDSCFSSNFRSAVPQLQLPADPHRVKACIRQFWFYVTCVLSWSFILYPTIPVEDEVYPVKRAEVFIAPRFASSCVHQSWLTSFQLVLDTNSNHLFTSSRHFNVMSNGCSAICRITFHCGHSTLNSVSSRQVAPETP